ncbi:hypothetical protein BU17DRAFT_58622 [Hysterangium stoloniferum]|nr:hypothetical protein BU17DRAFT_58622 [Hysterangium stoloniferum]
MPTFFTNKPFRFLITFLAAALFATEVEARPCVAFDAKFNLYAFGFGGKDFQLGTQDKWSSGVFTQYHSAVTGTEITTTGRPPFDGQQTTCYLAQFFNAIYVLDGDQSNPSAVHIFNAGDNSWSTQSVNSGGPDPTQLVAILDHDTNVFYALTNGQMAFLDMGSQITANSTALSWQGSTNPSFDVVNYKPTMALAQNHIHFIGVPNSQPGTAQIFVIHFSFFQPDPQSYPVSGSGDPFPVSHGQTASFFKDSGVQEEFAFIPDDGSATYVINVENNSTLPLVGPSDKTTSTYAASINALVQLNSNGGIFFLPYTPGDATQSRSATWSKINVQNLPAVSTNSTTPNGTGVSSTGSATGAAASGTGSPTPSKSSGATTVKIGACLTSLLGVVLAVTLARF